MKKQIPIIYLPSFIFFALCLTCVFTAKSEEAKKTKYPDEWENTEQFKNYLKNPYPISDVFFILPGKNIVRNKKELDGKILYRGSLQSDTFYLTPIEHKNSSGAIVSTVGDILGRSAVGTPWKIDAAAVKGLGGSINVTEDPNPNLSNPTEGEHHATMALLDLKKIQYYGMPYLLPNTVVWEGSNFQALFLSDGWPQNTNTYRVNGEVSFLDNNLPSRIKLRSSEWPSDVLNTFIEYKYSTNESKRFYPIETKMGLNLSNGRKLAVNGFKVVNIEFGTIDQPGGFKPSNFLTNEIQSAPNIIVTSNLTAYWYNGTELELVAAPASNLSLSSPLAKRWVMLGILLVVFSGVSLTWYKTAKKQKNK